MRYKVLLSIAFAAGFMYLCRVDNFNVMSEDNTTARVIGMQTKDYLQIIDFFVALAYPPHPLAAAPSAELGALDGLSQRDRAQVNKYWGGVKMAHSRFNSNK